MTIIVSLYKGSPKDVFYQALFYLAKGFRGNILCISQLIGIKFLFDADEIMKWDNLMKNLAYMLSVNDLPFGLNVSEEKKYSFISQSE